VSEASGGPGHVLVVDGAPGRPVDPAELDGHTLVPVREYLTGPWMDRPGLRVVNLTRDTSYGSAGYYASLLAEARGHRVIPSVRCLQDLSRRAIYGADLEDLDGEVARVLAEGAGGAGGENPSVLLFFGEAPAPELQRVARSLFEAFPAPILRVGFRRRDAWEIASVKPAGLRALPTEERPRFRDALERFLGRRWRNPRPRRPARWDLAILQDPDEKLPPSDRAALDAFERAARRAGMEPELITRRDLPRLAEFDALFIRETTAVDHHTWRFARRASAEGLVVIDDPDSILRCTNKIFLTELLQRAKVPIPPSVIVGREDLDRAATLGFPLVLKVPDGAFSLGVFKVRNAEELRLRAGELFARSELLLAQAYTPTTFDWRVGVLAGEPLFVCRYHMSRGHWQILNHAEEGAAAEGEVDTLAVEDAPPAVVATAVKAARLIGDGLYGVDLKQTPEGVFVIEVNDNPNIDAGYEDAVLGDALYDRIVGEFLRRLEAH
jgi:glutathione synthase/RimK-type ligase-like ATP-grasp enzyme